jgi:cardiolipin synthase
MKRARGSKTTTTVRSRFGRVIDPMRSFVQDHPWWHTTLICIGLIAFLSVLGGLFFAVGDKPKEVSPIARVPPVASPEFAIALSRLVNAPIEQGGSIQVLNNGDEFLPALLAGLNAARKTINFSVYIWTDGEFSDRVLDALIARQRAGVAVRVLLDGLGAKSAPDDRFKELEESGARIEKFRMPKFGKLTRFHRRNHRRSIVIDGEAGFTGGMAIYDKWLGNAQDPEHWRDMMFKVTGPLASSLQAAFVDAWIASAGELLVGPEIYPAQSSASGGVHRFIHYVNSPADDDLSMASFYLVPILAARQRVYIATPYFIPDDHLKRALEERARAGVDVRLLLPGGNIDNASARYSGQNHYDELMEAGVKIYEYRPTFIHSKFVVVDGEWSIIGSPNLNSRSRQLDEENAYGILDARLAAELERTFFADVKQADQIQLAEWRKRNPFLKLVQQLSRVLDQQS